MRLSVGREIFVYVQAIPVSLPPSIRKFQDLESLEFSMSHSSRKAISFAKSFGFSEITAFGFPAVLHESLARGATGCVPIPLCDDPVLQASFFPEHASSIIIGENSDWIFTGASLAGALAEFRGSKLHFLDIGDQAELPNNSIIVIKDSGENSGNIDVRRIESLMDVIFDHKGVLGDSTFSKLESREPEKISGETAEVVSLLSRKLRRITRG